MARGLARRRPLDLDRSEIRRAHDPQVFHVRLVVIEVVHDARALVDAVAGRDKGVLVLIHEAGPALHHVDDLEIGLVNVRAGAFLGCGVGANQMGDDPAAGGRLDAEVAV